MCLQQPQIEGQTTQGGILDTSSNQFSGGGFVGAPASTPTPASYMDFGGTQAPAYYTPPTWMGSISEGGGGGQGVDWSGLGKAGLKYGIPAAGAAYGAYQQAQMGKDLVNAQNQSYQNYLQTINPPPEAQEARFNELKSQITGSAPAAQRRLSDSLASRGVRGRGLASPIAGQARGTQQDINSAYRQIYGQYNVPSAPGPVPFAPSTGQLIGQGIGQVGGIDLLKKLYPGEG